MSTTSWFAEYESKARAAGDRERGSLLAFFRRALPLRDTNTAQALSLLEQGRAFAERLGEPWFVLYYDYWRIETLLYRGGGAPAALDLAIRANVEVRKPLYRQFPHRINLQVNLISAYLHLDPLGYAEAIENALRHLEAEINGEPEGLCRLQQLRSAFSLELDRLDEALSAALHMLERAEAANLDHYRINACGRLCTVSHRRKEWQDMLQWAQMGAELAARRDEPRKRLNLLMQQALATRQMGDEEGATRLYRMVMTQKDLLKTGFDDPRFNAQCDYHLVGGEWEHVVQLRQRRIAYYVRTGQTYAEAQCRVELCRLLMARNQPCDTAIAEAQEVSRRLRAPAKMLAELEDIARASRREGYR